MVWLVILGGLKDFVCGPRKLKGPNVCSNECRSSMCICAVIVRISNARRSCEQQIWLGCHICLATDICIQSLGGSENKKAPCGA